jgi:O-antigen/teichoic acid export membrane protein
MSAESEAGRDPAQRAPAEEGAADAASVGAETARALRGLFGRDSLYVLLWGLQLAFAALITPAATRLLTPYSFGRIQAASAVTTVLVAVGSMTLDAAIQRQYPQADGRRQARRLVTVAIILAGAMYLIAESTGSLWSPLLRLGSFHGALPYAVAWAALVAITYATLGWLRSHDQLWVFASVALIQSVGSAVLSLALVAFVKASAAEFLLGQVIGQAVAVVVALIAVRPLAVRRRDLPMVASALRYSGALVPATVAAFALAAADRLVIQHDLTSAVVARYSIAYNIGGVPLILIDVLATSWMPRLFVLSGKRARALVLSASRDAIYLLLVPTIIGLSAGAPLVLAAWAPSSYHPSNLLLVVALVSASALPTAGAMAATRGLMLTDKTSMVGWRTVLAAIIAVALTIALVPPLKIYGAAIATFVGFALLHFLLARAAHRVEPLPRPPLSLIVKCFAAVAVAALSTQLPTSAPFTAARAIVTLICLVLFIALLCELVAPERYPQLSRLARRLHAVNPAAD